MDFTYDKTLYDRLRAAAPDEIRRYLMADVGCQQHSAYFIENHDEPRAVTALGRERSLMAAVIMATLPGLRLFHDGQMEGRRVRVPVQLLREPEESPDAGVRRFYERLLEIVRAPAFHDGEWQLLAASPAWVGNGSHRSLLAWAWRSAGQFKVVVVNYSPDAAQGRLQLPLPPADAGQVTLLDELAGITYVREAVEVTGQGLYIALDPYHAHVFDVGKA